MATIYVTYQKEIKHPLDVKGMKYGVAAGGSMPAFGEYVGMKVVYIAQPEILTAFQQGVTDLYATGASTLVTLKAWEWVKYALVFQGDRPTGVSAWMMNPKT